MNDFTEFKATLKKLLIALVTFELDSENSSRNPFILVLATSFKDLLKELIFPVFVALTFCNNCMIALSSFMVSRNDDNGTLLISPVQKAANPSPNPLSLSPKSLISLSPNIFPSHPPELGTDLARPVISKPALVAASTAEESILPLTFSEKSTIP